MNRREEILFNTLKLASKNGLASVSMSQIAKETGIKKASLYNHFSSKDEIIEEMYNFLRENSKKQNNIKNIDYDNILENNSMKEILMNAVEAYRKLNSDSNMNMFYRIIMSERSINCKATDIMIYETKRMIEETKKLFNLLQEKNIAKFDNLETSAITFAMAVHSILDYEFDLLNIGQVETTNMMKNVIEDFCNKYEVRNYEAK